MFNDIDKKIDATARCVLFGGIVVSLLYGIDQMTGTTIGEGRGAIHIPGDPVAGVVAIVVGIGASIIVAELIAGFAQLIRNTTPITGRANGGATATTVRSTEQSREDLRTTTDTLGRDEVSSGAQTKNAYGLSWGD